VVQIGQFILLLVQQTPLIFINGSGTVKRNWHRRKCSRICNVCQPRYWQFAVNDDACPGSINAAGLDYAEYMVKDGDFVIAKGDIWRLKQTANTTNVFADAVSFVQIY